MIWVSSNQKQLSVIFCLYEMNIYKIQQLFVGIQQHLTSDILPSFSLPSMTPTVNWDLGHLWIIITHRLDIYETNIDPSSPRSAAWSSCRCDTLSSPWSRCPRCWRKSCWRSRLRSGTGRTFSRRCCCRWSAAWTCSQSSGRSHPAGRNAGLPSPSGGLVQWERKNIISVMKIHLNKGAISKKF